MPLDPDSKNFAKILGIKQSIASSMLTATARVRDQLLRPGADDGFAKVLAAIRAGAQEGDADEGLFD